MDTIVHAAATSELDQQYHLQSEMAEAQSHIFRISFNARSFNGST